MSNNAAAGRLARIQGGWYVITGIWPVIAPQAFQGVTGYKTDLWVAQTAGLLIAVSGAALLKAAKANRITPEIMLLAIGQAAVLGLVDVYCVTKPGTTWVYLLDAIAEAALVAAWIQAGRRKP